MRPPADAQPAATSCCSSAPIGGIYVKRIAALPGDRIAADRRHRRPERPAGRAAPVVAVRAGRRRRSGPSRRRRGGSSERFPGEAAPHRDLRHRLSPGDDCAPTVEFRRGHRLRCSATIATTAPTAAVPPATDAQASRCRSADAFAACPGSTTRAGSAGRGESGALIPVDEVAAGAFPNRARLPIVAPMSAAPYVPLRIFSCYTMLEGAIEPKAIAKQAKRLDFPAAALTDRNGLYARDAVHRRLHRGRACSRSSAPCSASRGPGRRRARRR